MFWPGRNVLFQTSCLGCLIQAAAAGEDALSWPRCLSQDIMSWTVHPISGIAARKPVADFMARTSELGHAVLARTSLHASCLRCPSQDIYVQFYFCPYRTLFLKIYIVFSVLWPRLPLEWASTNQMFDSLFTMGVSTGQ